MKSLSIWPLLLAFLLSASSALPQGKLELVEKEKGWRAMLEGEEAKIDFAPNPKQPGTFTLKVSGTKAFDMNVLADIPLSSLKLGGMKIKDLSVLKNKKYLKTINGKPAADFWKK